MATESVNIESLPENILLEVLSYLSVKDRCISGRVCRRWRKIVMDNSLWRHVDLLPYQVELRNLWKLIRAHLSSKLRTLRIRGVEDKKKHEIRPPLSESMVEDLRERCPSLSCLHMEPGNITNISATLLPASLTHLTLRCCMWQPRWFQGCAGHFSHLVYLDLTDTVRIDNHDMKDVAQFTSLRTLKLDNCYRLRETGLQELKTLTSLTSLNLQDCATTDLVLHHYGRHLTTLEHLDLSRSRLLTEASLPGIVEGMPKLKDLVLNGCVNLTANVFSTLSKSQSLRQVSLLLDGHLGICPLSEELVHPWREKMPKCTILI